MAKGPKETTSIFEQIDRLVFLAEDLIDLAIDQMSEGQTSLTVSLPGFAGFITAEEAEALEKKYREAGWKTVKIDLFDEKRTLLKEIFVVFLSKN